MRDYREEVREVIGGHYQGTLSTDRGRSHDAKELQEVKQQKCLSHILRSIDAVLETQSGQPHKSLLHFQERGVSHLSNGLMSLSLAESAFVLSSIATDED
jgi:hypothetical protein